MCNPECKKLRCISCQLHCELLPIPDLLSHQCLERQYCIWPNDNNFLYEGVASLLLSPDINVLGNGFIFVDFSFHNLALFSNSDWITHLSRSTLRLVLVTDSRMEALATYWQRHCSAITTVLYSDNDRHVIASKIKKAISGLQTKETRRKKLTEYEVSVLQRLLRGEAVKDICYELEANRNSIYNVIRSLKNKLGGSLYHLQTH